MTWLSDSNPFGVNRIPGMVGASTNSTIGNVVMVPVAVDPDTGAVLQWQATNNDSTNDAFSSYEKGWTPIALSASGVALAAPGTVRRIICATSSSLVIGIADKISSGGTAIPGNFTLTAGQVLELGWLMSNGCYITFVSGTGTIAVAVRAGTQA